MHITDIAQTKKGRYAIHVEGEFLFSLHIDILASSHLKIGDEVSIEELEELRRASELRITKDRALRLLSAKSHTSKQLLERLERYTDRDIAQSAVERMQELGLVNDREYALLCARDLFHLRHFSPSRIRQELRCRGVEDWIADEAAAQFDEDDTQAALLSLVERKYRSGLDQQKGRQRAINALQRRGFGYEDIRKAINQVLEEQEWEESQEWQ